MATTRKAIDAGERRTRMSELVAARDQAEGEAAVAAGERAAAEKKVRAAKKRAAEATAEIARLATE